MDIGGMDMGGGDPGSPTDFLPTNKHIARIYWYLIVALVAAAGLRRLSTALHTLYMYVLSPFTYQSKQLTILQSTLADTLSSSCLSTCWDPHSAHRNFHRHRPRNIISSALVCLRAHCSSFQSASARRLPRRHHLLGRHSRHAVVRCHPVAEFKHLRIQMGDCRIPRSLGLRLSNSTLIPAILQDQPRHPHHWHVC